MKRSELLFSAFCAASGVAALLAIFGALDIAGTLPLGLYPFYSLAAVAGWIGGNVFVGRLRDRAARRSLLVAVYAIGPAGPISLLRAMGDPQALLRAPAVPLFAYGVYLVLFLVPISLRSSAPSRTSVRLRRRAESETSANDIRGESR